MHFSAAAQLDCKYEPTPINSERHTSILFSSEADTNESHCATATPGALERWSWRAVSAPDSWRHLGIIEGNLLAGRLTVGGDVDFVRQLSHVDLEAVLHVIQGLGVGLVRHEGYGQTFGSEPTCTGNLTEWRRRQSSVDKHTNNKKKKEAKRTIAKSITPTLTLCK